MRKVNLSMHEVIKYKTIKALVDKNGNKKVTAIKLKCSINTVN